MPQANAVAYAPTEPPWGPDLIQKQYDLMNDTHRMLLVSGPMKTGKSIGICHKVVRHLWEVNGAYFAIFVTSYKVATDGGAWTDLTKIVMPEWLEAGIEGDDGPIQYTSFVRGDDEGGPKLDAKSRTPFFRIRNMHGGESECRLFSVDNENEAEAKIKGLRLSGAWMVELSTFKSRKVFDLVYNRMRSGWGVPYEDQFLVADTNPAEEGKEHWAYQMFYKDRLDPNFDGDKEFQAELGLIEIFLDDNTKLDEREKRGLRNIYRNSPEEYDRFVLGLWPEGSSRRREVFGDILTPLHFPSGPIDVFRATEVLSTGWDMGAVNSAFGIVERRVVGGIDYWMALDELVFIDKEISTADFTLGAMDKMIKINEFYKSHWGGGFPGFRWRHWSDNSSTAVYRPTIGTVEATVVYKVSDGQIELSGVEKAQGSVEEDVKLFRMLIREGRLFVGQNCPQLKKALEKIKRNGRGQIDPGDPLKHVWDAFRYAIRAEWMDDLSLRNVGEEREGSRLIHRPIA